MCHLIQVKRKQTRRKKKKKPNKSKVNKIIDSKVLPDKNYRKECKAVLKRIGNILKNNVSERYRPAEVIKVLVVVLYKSFLTLSLFAMQYSVQGYFCRCLRTKYHCRNIAESNGLFWNENTLFFLVEIIEANGA